MSKQVFNDSSFMMTQQQVKQQHPYQDDQLSNENTEMKLYIRAADDRFISENLNNKGNVVRGSQISKSIDKKSHLAHRSLTKRYTCYTQGSSNSQFRN